jgi:dihydroxy-acid dehydratase
LLRDGDIIEIDIPNNAINVRLSDEELAKRRKAWTPPAPRITKGCLAKYASMATSADTGAVLKW